MKFPIPLTFDWDEERWEIEEIFFNKPIKIFPDVNHSQTEHRFLAYGKTNTNNLLSVVFTIRDQKLRVISAGRQNKKERYIYET